MWEMHPASDECPHSPSATDRRDPSRENGHEGQEITCPVGGIPARSDRPGPQFESFQVASHALPPVGWPHRLRCAKQTVLGHGIYSELHNAHRTEALYETDGAEVEIPMSTLSTLEIGFPVHTREGVTGSACRGSRRGDNRHVRSVGSCGEAEGVVPCLTEWKLPCV